jgi:hypothetical protein
VQIQAYLDNVFDVGALLEDAETKNAALERVEELEENMSHVRRNDNHAQTYCLYPITLPTEDSLPPYLFDNSLCRPLYLNPQSRVQ